MTADRGRHRIDIASGPLATRQLAEAIANQLNDTDPEQWDRFFKLELPHILAGEWG